MFEFYVIVFHITYAVLGLRRMGNGVAYCDIHNNVCITKGVRNI